MGRVGNHRGLRLSSVALVVALAFAGGPALSSAPADALPPPVADPGCPEVTDSIHRLYSAYFLRAPDESGVAYWTNRYMSGDRNLRQISDAFAASPEFLARYGSLDDGEFIDLLYQNIFGRQADSGGAEYWGGRLAAGLTRGALMIGFSESAEYINQTGTMQPLAGIGRAYPVGTTFACGRGAGTAVLRTGDRPMNIDVLGINDSPQRAQNLLVFVGTPGQSGRELVANEILSPHEYFLLWNGRIEGPASPAAERLVVVESADVDLHWVVVAYPVGSAPDRPGWNNRAPLQLR